MLLREPEDRAQLIAILHAAHDRALVGADALSMMEGVLQVSELTARDIMVQRAQMDMIDIADTLDRIVPFAIRTAHSRFPVYEGQRDNVIGILLAKDLLRCFQNPATTDLRVLLRPAIFIPESKRLNVLLREFRSNRNHLAIVIDEYGSTAGIVTIEDVLEQIVGEIEDEFDDDEEEGDIYSLADGSFRVSGDTPIERINEHFEVEIHPSDTEDEDSFETIGGLIAHEMGHVPTRNEFITLAGLNFVVMLTKGGAVRWFKVTPAAQAAS